MAGARWFIARNNEKVGPFAAPELQQMARVGLLAPDEHVWVEGAGKWLAAGSLPGLFPKPVEKKFETVPLTPSAAQVQGGALEFEEAALHLAGKEGDVLAQLISTLLDMKRNYASNPGLVQSLEHSIAVLRAKRAEKSP